MKPVETDDHGNIFTHVNAFQLIGMSSFLDLSGFFEKEVSFGFDSALMFHSLFSPFI